MSERLSIKHRAMPAGDSEWMALQRLARIPEANPFPILRVAYDGTIRYRNPAARRLPATLGCQGCSIRDVMPDDFEAVIRTLIDEHRTLVEAPHEFRDHSLLITYRPFQEMRQMFVTVVDVTERVRVEQQVREYAALLERRNRELRDSQAQLLQSEKLVALGSLVAGVAHEVNTPLGAIKANAQTCLSALSVIKEVADDPLANHLIERHPKLVRAVVALEQMAGGLTEASGRIDDIVTAMRNFVRLDEAEYKRADVLEGVRSTLTLLNHRMPDDLELVRTLEPVPATLCFPNQLNQVFMHLLVNAIEAIERAPDDRVHSIRVSSGVNPHGDLIRLEFSDTGVGIPEADLPRVFDPGYTTRGPGIGTGFGLSTCFRVMQDHDGNIRLRSTPGEGTVVTLELPVI